MDLGFGHFLTHFHVLASLETVKQMSKFMCHLKTDMSKEVGAFTTGKAPCSPDEIARFYWAVLASIPEFKIVERAEAAKK